MFNTSLHIKPENKKYYDPSATKYVYSTVTGSWQKPLPPYFYLFFYTITMIMMMIIIISIIIVIIMNFRNLRLQRWLIWILSARMWPPYSLVKFYRLEETRCFHHQVMIILRKIKIDFQQTWCHISRLWRWRKQFFSEYPINLYKTVRRRCSVHNDIARSGPWRLFQPQDARSPPPSLPTSSPITYYLLFCK